MADYHVGASALTGEIYAGTLTKSGNLWKTQSNVTDEAICAVRDHLVNQMQKSKQDWFGYEWTRKDGKKVVLSVTVKGEANDHQ